jgi:hypothetical protein
MDLAKLIEFFERRLPTQLARILAFLSWPLAKLVDQIPVILEIFLVKRPLAKKELDRWEVEKASLLEKARANQRREVE